MNSKERVLTAFNHEEPDLVPRWCGTSPEFWEKAKKELNLDDEGLRIRLGDDFRRIFAHYKNAALNLSKEDNITPFRIEREGIGYGQPKSNPLSNVTLEEIHNYTWPDPKNVDISNLRKEATKYYHDFAILGGDWSPFWHDVIDLFGMEDLFIKMYTEPEIVDEVFHYVMNYYLAVNERILDEAADLIDIFFIGNDFGSQTGPLIGENIFRRFILPHLKKLIDLGHNYNLKVMLHCCGGFKELIPSMIEIGLDGVHAIQPRCYGMNLRKLKSTFGDRILFNGCIDSHHVLIKGTPDRIRKKTIETIDIMKPGGGFIAGASHDYILEETPVMNVVTMFDTIREYGTY